MLVGDTGWNNPQAPRIPPRASNPAGPAHLGKAGRPWSQTPLNKTRHVLPPGPSPGWQGRAPGWESQDDALSSHFHLLRCWISLCPKNKWTKSSSWQHLVLFLSCQRESLPGNLQEVDLQEGRVSGMQEKELGVEARPRERHLVFRTYRGLEYIYLCAMHGPEISFFFCCIISIFNHFYWSRVDLQCCVNFYCTAK